MDTHRNIAEASFLVGGYSTSQESQRKIMKECHEDARFCSLSEEHPRYSKLYGEHVRIIKVRKLFKSKR